MSEKIADLRIEHWRHALQFADDWRVLPRPYLWGLADTVRAGVEGRGAPEHLIYGKLYEGRPPSFTWPAVISGKVPLALLGLALLGGFALWGRPLNGGARWMLIALAGVSAAHLVALAGSLGTYAGVRHALPLVVALAIVAGAVSARALATRSRPWAAAFAGLWLIALGMTAREPRIWEYHNELAGGSENAWRYFSNEGLDLGQRFGEFSKYHREVIKPSGRPYYAVGWTILEEQVSANIELGNAHLRLEHREAAIAAFANALSNVRPGDLTGQELETALTRLRAGEPMPAIRPVRNPTME